MGGKVAGIAGTGLTVAADANDYFGDRKIGKYDVRDFPVDTGVDFANVAVATAAGAADGSAFVPPLEQSSVQWSGQLRASCLRWRPMRRRRRSKMRTRSSVPTGMSVAEANLNYFRTLANTRASLGSIAGLGVPIMVMSDAMDLGTLSPAALEGFGVITAIFHFNLALLCVCALAVIVSVFKSLSLRFQVFFSAVSAGIALALVYCLCLMALVLATVYNAESNSVAVMWFSIGGVATVLLLAGAIGVHVLLLRHRLRGGHSEKRTIGIFVAMSGPSRAKIMWITLAVVVVVPNVLTRGQYFIDTFGVLAIILFACVTTSLPVELAYLAYLKSKDRVYGRSALARCRELSGAGSRRRSCCGRSASCGDRPVLVVGDVWRLTVSPWRCPAARTVASAGCLSHAGICWELRSSAEMEEGCCEAETAHAEYEQCRQLHARSTGRRRAA